MDRFFYVASQDASGGIALCSLDEKGRISRRDFYPLDRVSWLCSEGDRLYALMREAYMGQSGVMEYLIGKDGSLYPVGKPLPTHGSIAAHALSSGGKLYCANYLSGTSILMPDKLLAYNGSSVEPRRQSCSHPHCVTASPNGQQLFICDLGTDEIHVCTRELELLYNIALPAGSGPRHLVFSKDRKYAYCSLELCNAVAVLEFAGDRLNYLKSYSTVPKDCSEKNFPSAIRLSPDGKRLFVSNRGHGSVCVFSVQGGEVQEEGYVNCGIGLSLREINIIGNFLLCADELKGSIYVFALDYCVGAAPVEVFRIKRPWCILPV